MRFWRLWQSQVESEQSRYELSRFKQSRYDLSRFELSQSKLSQSKLSKSELSRSELSWFELFRSGTHDWIVRTVTWWVDNYQIVRSESFASLSIVLSRTTNLYSVLILLYKSQPSFFPIFRFSKIFKKFSKISSVVLKSHFKSGRSWVNVDSP